VLGGQALFGHSTHTIFLYFFAIFLGSTGQIFSQIPQALFTELIGLALLFSLFPSRRGRRRSLFAVQRRAPR
jgi:Na+/melibiose symporter-like transporter